VTRWVGGRAEKRVGQGRLAAVESGRKVVERENHRRSRTRRGREEGREEERDEGDSSSEREG
jgi:hypothetical protein